MILVTFYSSQAQPTCLERKAICWGPFLVIPILEHDVEQRLM
jgi:hypothetical protein